MGLEINLENLDDSDRNFLNEINRLSLEGKLTLYEGTTDFDFQLAIVENMSGVRVYQTEGNETTYITTLGIPPHKDDIRESIDFILYIYKNLEQRLQREITIAIRRDKGYPKEKYHYIAKETVRELLRYFEQKN